ncbi:hypothetical protein K523DRAFT_418662 [Schizophyllum commune Tattone D]|nr:hypothetical protein K523DRAFT_418662 [Schizophyllum commune Tattone D]
MSAPAAPRANTSRVAFAGASPLGPPETIDPQNEPRSWQIPRRFAGRYVLGWLATDELCRGVCLRGCPTSFHDANGELTEDESMDDHVDYLQQALGLRVARVFRLACVGSRVVYTSRDRSQLSWAIVVSDSKGLNSHERRVPSPEVVDRIKRWLGTEEEPRWFKALD